MATDVTADKGDLCRRPRRARFRSGPHARGAGVHRRPAPAVQPDTRSNCSLARAERQRRLDAGEMPDFRADTADIRAGDWLVARAPADLNDRRVEITGPAEPKMMINALNSGARVFMADLEDALSPTWANVVGGQAALQDAVRRELEFTSPEGKAYRLNEKTATLLVRPRGWHLPEAHVLVDGEPISASLFDFGLYFFHNAAESVRRGSGPYFYLPKLEASEEARLWNDVFNAAQDALEHSARHHPRDGPDRDDPRRVRDGRRSCTSCAIMPRA